MANQSRIFCLCITHAHDKDGCFRSPVAKIPGGDGPNAELEACKISWVTSQRRPPLLAHGLFTGALCTCASEGAFVYANSSNRRGFCFASRRCDFGTCQTRRGNAHSDRRQTRLLKAPQCSRVLPLNERLFGI